MTLGISLSEELRTALDQFHNLDWTFEQEKTNLGLHSIHPYPARFVPQIPRNLIQLFQPIANGPVLDPFCGCGTTLVESQAKGIASFGIDLNPIAALISNVKINPPHQEIGPTASQLAVVAKASTDNTFPDIPRLAHWFSRGTALALAKLTGRFAMSPTPGFTMPYGLHCHESLLGFLVKTAIPATLRLTVPLTRPMSTNFLWSQQEFSTKSSRWSIPICPVNGHRAECLSRMSLPLNLMNCLINLD